MSSPEGWLAFTWEKIWRGGSIVALVVVVVGGGKWVGNKRWTCVRLAGFHLGEDLERGQWQRERGSWRGEE